MQAFQNSVNIAMCNRVGKEDKMFFRENLSYVITMEALSLLPAVMKLCWLLRLIFHLLQRQEKRNHTPVSDERIFMNEFGWMIETDMEHNEDIMKMI